MTLTEQPGWMNHTADVDIMIGLFPIILTQCRHESAPVPIAKRSNELDYHPAKIPHFTRYLVCDHDGDAPDRLLELTGLEQRL